MTDFAFLERIRQGLQRRARRRRLADRSRRAGRAADVAPPNSRLSLLLLSLPGLAAVAALLFTWLQVGQAGKQLQIIEDQQITTRFNAAVGNLASKSVDVRLGGIYALERIMKNSAADQPSIVSVLSAYVRQHAPLPRKTAPSADIPAAMNVLGRREPRYDEGLELDLSRTDLRGWQPTPRVAGRGIRLPSANLAGVDLRNAYLEGADLSGSLLEKANLAGADLAQVDLTSSYLGEARLNDTSFIKANLTNIQLCMSETTTCPDLTGTDFSGADLRGASLGPADLRQVTFCGHGQYVTPPGSDKDVAVGCASLREADLTSVNLRGANLRGVDLSYAELDGADLTGADLTNAKLTGTRLTGAKIAGVAGLPAAPPPDTSR
ncbi:pentapeptide repeat-containing protein [Streptomyces caniscabiei]|uniref:pentapeptide repeat-containing protein n=1 Tax=Streptomyces caniscabiei TaxID=2746961 RepID=UPI000A35F454|nr:pentapeptide repeat-containing protein [Streptomyces caniscabiei]